MIGLDICRFVYCGTAPFSGIAGKTPHCGCEINIPFLCTLCHMFFDRFQQLLDNRLILSDSPVRANVCMIFAVFH
jgi:hypothetical protein